MDLNTIASNIATRFSAANITAPSGLENVTFSTHLLPNKITTTPCVLVKPPQIDLEYAAGARRGELHFPVEFYVSGASELPERAQLLYSWFGVLLDQLTADYDIGAPSEVVDATIVASQAGTLVYAGVEYAAIQFTVRVRIDGSYPATT